MNKTWVRFGRCRRWRSGVNVLTFQRECAEHTEAGGGVGGGVGDKRFASLGTTERWPPLFVSSSADA